MELDSLVYFGLAPKHKKLANMLMKEEYRQHYNAELIASENYCSKEIRLAMASCLTNKYAEGKPGMRYYGGCEFVDEIESYCQELWQKVFNTDYHVNVQPHSGSQANACAFAAVLKPGDTVLSLDLNSGGHLTHGSSVNFSGKLYNFINYKLNDDGIIDMDDVKNKAKEFKPKLILAGASAYPRKIDFEKFSKIAHDNDCLFMVDMAHIAGLVAANLHESPFGYADIVTTTTHKTLRGPRGGLIFCKKELEKAIDKAVFPGNQGGPLEHVILAKAICAEEALSSDFKEYMHRVVLNCRVMANRFIELGYDVVAGGTDNHMFLIDFSRTHPELTGKLIEDRLEEHNITLNKNCVPNEKKSPNHTSGVRIGTAAMTTKGWTETDFIKCADDIDLLIEELSMEIVGEH